MNQKRKETCVLSYLVPYDESTSIDKYDDEFPVVVRRGISLVMESFSLRRSYACLESRHQCIAH